MRVIKTITVKCLLILHLRYTVQNTQYTQKYMKLLRRFKRCSGECIHIQRQVSCIQNIVGKQRAKHKTKERMRTPLRSI